MTETAAAIAVDLLRITLDELREAWSWLDALVEPGHTASGAATAIDDARADRLEAIGHSDRAYRMWNLRQGMSALPPSPAPARIGIIDAQVDVHFAVTTAVLLLAKTGNATTQLMAERAAATVPTALDWLAPEWPGLGRDGGDGVWCRTGAIDRIRDAQLAEDVHRHIRRANRVARAAAREDVDASNILPLPQRCPACGRRSLQVERPAVDRRTWVVRCVSAACRCAGEGECGCGGGRDRAGRRHVWPYGELDGHAGLLQAVDRLASERPVIRSGAAGHGGWQSRNMAGQQ